MPQPRTHLLLAPLVLGCLALCGLVAAHLNTASRFEAVALLACCATVLLAAWLLARAMRRWAATSPRAREAERARLALEASGTAIWDVDLTSGAGGTAFYSTRWKEMLGYTEEDLGNSPLTFDQLEHPEDLPKTLAMRDRLNRGETDYIEHEHRMRRKDGGYLWVLARGKVMSRGADGMPARIVGTNIDITLRKEAEAAIESSRVLLTTIVDALPQYVFWKNREGVYLGCNDAYARAAGKSSPRELVGLTDFQLPWPEGAAKMMYASDEKVMSSGVPVLNEERSLKVFVDVALTSLIPLRDRRGVVVGLVGVIIDITDRKRAEDEVRASEERWSLALRTSGDAVWDVDLERKTAYLSPRWREMLGYSDHEVDMSNLGRGFLDLVHPDDAERVRVELAQVLKGELPALECEYRMRCKDGSYRLIDARGKVVARDPSGRALRFIGTHTDVTERHAERAQLAQARKLEAIGQLAAGVAHEINTPMQYISDSVHFLKDGFQDLVKGGLSEGDRQYVMDNIPRALARTLDGIDRVIGIVKAMKEFSHPGHAEKSLGDLNQALSSTLAVATNEYKYIADVDTDFGDLPLVPCHIGELNQVFLNLIVNAAHAVGEVVARTQQRGTIHVRTRVESDSAVIEISDSGGGIPAGAGERIFEPFFTTKPPGKGTGQGLAIARSIVVDKHQGSIDAHNGPDGGAVFTIRLPLRIAQVEAA